jgi:hypothetical protein
VKRTINNAVEAVHLQLIANDRYIDLLSATDNSQAVGGSMFNDDVLAAVMISDYAKLNGHCEVAKANLATIRKALYVVLRRFGMTRKQRRAALLRS